MNVLRNRLSFEGIFPLFVIMLLYVGDNTSQWECFSSHNPYSASRKAV